MTDISPSPRVKLVHAATGADVTAADLREHVLELVASHNEPVSYMLASFSELVGIDTLFWEITDQAVTDGVLLDVDGKLAPSEAEMERWIAIWNERRDARLAEQEAS